MEEKKSFFSFFKTPISNAVAILTVIFGIILYAIEKLTFIQGIILSLFIIIFLLLNACYSVYKRYSEYISLFKKTKDNNRGLLSAKRKYFQENKELKQQNTNLISEYNQLQQLLESKNQTIDNKNQILIYLIINLPKEYLPKENKDFILSQVMSNYPKKGADTHERKKVKNY